jgi:hypothetical protein
MLAECPGNARQGTLDAVPRSADNGVRRQNADSRRRIHQGNPGRLCAVIFLRDRPRDRAHVRHGPGHPNRSQGNRYFEVLTTIALIIGLVVVNVLKPGVGTQSYIAQTQHHDVASSLIDIIPNTIVGDDMMYPRSPNIVPRTRDLSTIPANGCAICSRRFHVALFWVHYRFFQR